MQNLSVDFTFAFTAVAGNSLELEMGNMAGRQTWNTSLNCAWNVCCKIEIRNKEMAHIGDYILNLWQIETLIYTIILDITCMQGIYINIGYIVLQLFCSYNLLDMLYHFSWLTFCTVTLALSAVSVQCQIWLFLQFLFFELSRYVAQVLSISETVPVAPLITDFILFSHSTCAEFLLRSIYILKSSLFFLDHISVSRNCNIN